MFGINYPNSDNRKQKQLTPGQFFDIADAGIDTFKGFRGGSGPFTKTTATMGGLDIALSTGLSKPEELLGNTISSSVSVISSMTLGYSAGRFLGRGIGAVVGGVFGGPWGATTGGTVGGWIGGVAFPFVTDPIIRKISKPINRIVGLGQRRLNFGRGYQDSSQAYTMRMRGLQELQGSLLNATRYLGVEAQLVHQ